MDTKSSLSWAAMNKNLLAYGITNSPVLRTTFSSSGKILLPGQENKETGHPLISSFLKKWLTEKQVEGMGSWFEDLLSSFAKETLLYAKEVGGIDRLLHELTTSKRIEKLGLRSKIKFDAPKLELPIVPQKPKRLEIQLEDMGNDLLSDVRVERTHLPKKIEFSEGCD